VWNSSAKMTRLAAALALALLAFAAFAGAQTPIPSISASTPQTGWIALQVSGPAGDQVTIQEVTSTGAVPVASATIPAAGTLDLPKAAQWNCASSTRTFLATFVASDGGSQTSTTHIATPTCTHRLRVRLSPRRVRARRAATIRIIDRWSLGALSGRACDAAPGARRSCRRFGLPPGRSRAEVQLRPRRPGRYAILVTSEGAKARASLLVKPRSGRLRVLATGDSMIQIIDGDLAQRLARIEPTKLKSDAHISTGISKPFMLNWPKHAAATAHTFHPDVTIVFLGANDGFPMSTPSGRRVNCCGPDWVTEYAGRVRHMMRSYARRGAGTVYWLLLPAPRGRNFRAVFGPVNAALIRAARANEGVVHLVDLRKVFSPHGQFRQYVRWHGHTVSARQPDGVHLSVGGAAIATDLIVRALRRDHVLGG
jgi:lysophospholipase L1-like esterase